MLFSDRLPDQGLLSVKNATREKLLQKLLSDFRVAFPELTFDARLDSPVVNAQALSLLNDERVVIIYGGLALDPRLGSDSLIFILLHEAGHHLAEGCRLQHDPSLACECAADYWATSVGAKTLHQTCGRDLQLEVALSQLHFVLGYRQKRRAGYTQKSSACWAGSWTLRSRALRKSARPPNRLKTCVTYA